MKVFKNFSLLILLLVTSSVFALAQTGGVKGRVRSNKGEGIASVTVSARLKGEEVKSVKSDAKGNFVLDGLEAGIYNVSFEKNGFSTGIRYNVEVKSGSINDLGDRLILNLDPGTQVIVKGSVFDKNGFGVFNAKIEIQRIGEDGKTKKVGTGYTSESGEFTFKFPEASAKFRVIASAKGAKASKDIEVESAAIYRLALTLDVEIRK
jgi:Carboxypeptidase regulatory-like domain